MYDDNDVQTYADRLCSHDADVRALAADEATDGVADWGHHSYTAPQAARITGALVDALACEIDPNARESLLNAIATLVEWDLAPIREVTRAIELPRPLDEALADYWTDIEEWADRQR